MCLASTTQGTTQGGMRLQATESNIQQVPTTDD